MNGKSHAWTFFRSGGVDQVAIKNGSDLAHLRELDQKLWVALAMPTRGVEFDARTLDLIDTDHDGRIRAPELLAAIEWIVARIQNPDDLMAGTAAVKLSAIKDEGLLAGCKRVLANLNLPDATEITLAEFGDTDKIFAETRFNGDGVIPEESADDEDTKVIIQEIKKTFGEVKDRSGKMGIDQEKSDAFFTAVETVDAWYQRSRQAPLSVQDTPDLPALAAAAGVLRGKIDDYFTRTDLAAFDPAHSAQLNASESDFIALFAKELNAQSEEVACLPLAHIAPRQPLPLTGAVNPAWAEPLRALAAAMTKSGDATLTEGEWTALKTRVAPYGAWESEKPTTAVDGLGTDRILALAHSGARAKIDALIKADLALATEHDQIESVERLVRYHRDLWRLVHNFVNFADFYSKRGAIFQIGTLYLDARSCGLCVLVADAAKHAQLAPLASTYLAYCDCTRPNGEKLQIAAAFTDGDSDNLMIGRNGVFYDHKGQDWDATITKVIAQPISVREAFWAPYKKLVRLIEEQVGKRAAAADADANKALAATAAATANADKTAPAPAAAAPTAHKIDVGTVAALGVAIGGIGALITGVLSVFFGLGVWMPIGLLGVMLLISGPSMLLAYLKLRQRNLGPILDANGWAVNGRARINVPFGAALTDLPHLPPGASRSLHDPYADKKSPFMLYVIFLVLAVAAGTWYLGKLDRWLPESATSVKVLGAHAPAAKRAAKEAADPKPSPAPAPDKK